MNNHAITFLQALIISICLICVPSFSMDPSFATSNLENEDILNAPSQIFTSSSQDFFPENYIAPLSTTPSITQIPSYINFYNSIDTFSNPKIPENKKEALERAKKAAKEIESLGSGMDPRINSLLKALEPNPETIKFAKQGVNDVYFGLPQYVQDLPTVITWFMSNFDSNSSTSKQNAILILEYAKNQDPNYGHKTTIESIIKEINDKNQPDDVIRSRGKTVAGYFESKKTASTPSKTLRSKKKKVAQPTKTLSSQQTSNPENLFKSALHYKEPVSVGISGKWEPLAKDSFLDFYKAINTYLKYHDIKDLDKAKLYLQNNFSSPAIAGIPPYRDFMEKLIATRDEIDSVKDALNGYYFLRHLDDLCKSIPFFLEAIVQNNNNDTKQDAIRIVKRLLTTTKDSSEKTNIYNTIGSILDITNEQSMMSCLKALDDVCHFFPDKDFKKASENLQEYELMSLSRFDKYNDKKKEEIINSIKKNISAMIEFIQPKSSADETRINALNKIKNDITMEKEYTIDLLNQWIDKIRDITKETLKPSIEGSTLGLARRQQTREAEQQAQKEEQEQLKRQQKDVEDFILQDYSAFLVYPKKIIDYINNKDDWSIETKVSFLQLLFWYNYTEEQERLKDSKQAPVNQSLRDVIKALAQNKDSVKSILLEMAKKDPNIVGPQWDESGKQEKKNLVTEKAETFAEKGSESLARVTHNKNGVVLPYFTFTFDSVPEDAPESLKNLFNKYKQEESASATYQPFLAIERLYEGIKTLKNLLQQIDLSKQIPDEQIAEEESFEKWQKPLSSEKEPLSEEERRKKTEYSPKSALLEPMLTPEEQKKRETEYHEKRSLYQTQRTALIRQLRAQPKKTKQIEESITKKQQEMEALISAEITNIEKALEKNDTEFLTTIENKLNASKKLEEESKITIEDKLKDFKKYVSPDNTLLQKQIQRVQYRVAKNRAKGKPATVLAMDTLIGNITKEINALQSEQQKTVSKTLPTMQKDSSKQEKINPQPIISTTPPLQQTPVSTHEPSLGKGTITGQQPQSPTTSQFEPTEIPKTFVPKASTPILTPMPAPKIDVKEEPQIIDKVAYAIQELRDLITEKWNDPSERDVAIQNRSTYTDLLEIAKGSLTDQEEKTIKGIIQEMENIEQAKKYAQELRSLLLEWKKPEAAKMKLSDDVIKKYLNMLSEAAAYQTITDKEKTEIEKIINSMKQKNDVNQLISAITSKNSPDKNISDIVFYIINIAQNIENFSFDEDNKKHVASHVKELSELASDINKWAKKHDQSEQLAKNSQKIRTYIPDFPELGKEVVMSSPPVITTQTTVQSTAPQPSDLPQQKPNPAVQPPKERKDRVTVTPPVTSAITQKGESPTTSTATNITPTTAPGTSPQLPQPEQTPEKPTQGVLSSMWQRITSAWNSFWSTIREWFPRAGG